MIRDLYFWILFDGPVGKWLDKVSWKYFNGVPSEDKTKPGVRYYKERE